jgi:hypothetical protein
MTAEEFIHHIKTTPIYVGFYHGEFDTCPTPRPADPAMQPTIPVPENVSIMQLTKPGEILSIQSSILYYLFHKKQFYTHTLMPLFAVRSPADILAHKDAEYLYWDMEKRKGYAARELRNAGKKLLDIETAKDAMKLMKDVTEHKKYEPSDKTHYSEVYRFMGGDPVDNILLSQIDTSIAGLGAYKYAPDTGKVVKVLLEAMPDFPKTGDIRLYHLLNYISRTGGGRLMLFSCNSLADVGNSRYVAKAQEARTRIQRLQESYIARNPVMSSERDWHLFEEAFPKIYMPNLEFMNPLSLKALDNNWMQWILYNLLVSALENKDLATNMSGLMRNAALQRTAAYGRRLQNLDDDLGNTAPAPGETVRSYICRRGKKNCTIQGGGTRKTHVGGTRRTSIRRRKRARTRRM